MKYARIVKIFADKLHMPYEDALDFFIIQTLTS